MARSSVHAGKIQVRAERYRLLRTSLPRLVQILERKSTVLDDGRPVRLRLR